MTVLDHFAAHTPPPKDKNATPLEIAQWNYECAQEMLKERSR